MSEPRHLVTMETPLPVRRFRNDSAGRQDVGIGELVRGHQPRGDPESAVGPLVQIFVVPMVGKGHPQTYGGRHPTYPIHSGAEVGVSGHQHQTVRPSRLRQLEHLHRDGNVGLLLFEALHRDHDLGEREPQLPTLPGNEEPTPGEAGPSGLFLEPGKGDVNAGVLQGFQKGAMPAYHIGPLEMVGKGREVVPALKSSSGSEAAGNQGGAEGVEVEPTEGSKVRGPLCCSNGVVEVEPVHKERDPHGGTGKEKAPGPRPRGTRETAVFGGDSPSTINPVDPEGKPNARRFPSRCLGSMGYKLRRIAGHPHSPTGLLMMSDRQAFG